VSASLDSLDAIAERYRSFAVDEARGRSPLYEELALGVSGDAGVLRFLAGYERAKQQPNLFLAAVRHACGTASGWPQFRGWVAAHGDEIAAVMLARRTQTNEPARCATLLPVLAMLEPPLALVEVGAAAGLCLLPDHYGYDFGGRRVPPGVDVGVPAPLFRCEVRGDVTVPDESPPVVWRRGLDLSPIDIDDREQVEWLKTLVWPGEGDRVELLEQSLEVARAARPVVLRGDLTADLEPLLAQAPDDATLVVFHTAVLNYVDEAGRSAFTDVVRASRAVWIANEGTRVQPRAAARLRDRPSPRDAFLLSVDEEPVAWTDGHGTSVEWFGSRC
jgi:hypothetical protein